MCIPDTLSQVIPTGHAIWRRLWRLQEVCLEEEDLEGGKLLGLLSPLPRTFCLTMDPGSTELAVRLGTLGNPERKPLFPVRVVYFKHLVTSWLTQMVCCIFVKIHSHGFTQFPR